MFQLHDCKFEQKLIVLHPFRFDPEDIRKFKSVPTGNKKFSADYDWNDQVNYSKFNKPQL